MSVAFVFILLILAFAIAAMVIGFTFALQQRILKGAGLGPRCGNCSYNLTGSGTNLCPECGKLFIEAGVLVPPGPEAVRRVRSTMIRTSVIFVAVFVLIISLVLLASFAVIRAQGAAMAQAQAAAAQAKAAAANAFLQQSLAATSRPAMPASQPASK
jgi:hypothetical protein